MFPDIRNNFAKLCRKFQVYLAENIVIPHSKDQCNQSQWTVCGYIQDTFRGKPSYHIVISDVLCQTFWCSTQILLPHDFSR